jgi:hypothetical protein
MSEKIMDRLVREHLQKDCFWLDGKTKRPSVEDALDIITIKPSPTADTRSCDWSKVSKDQLCDSSVQHREDVVKGFEFFIRMMARQATLHDHDKLSDIDGFHADFQTGFEKAEWWDRHRKINRHHLLQEDGVPEDVNLIDVLDMVIDCTMAGLARTGEVYPLELSADVLQRAFKNTCELLKSHIVVEEE